MECRRGAWAVGLEAAGVDGGSNGHGEPASLVTIATSTGRVLHQQPRHVPRGRVCPGTRQELSDNINTFRVIRLRNLMPTVNINTRNNYL